MRRAALVVAIAVLLGGPTVLAFFAGGYFDGPRAAAAAVAWAVVFVLALFGPLPWPASGPGRVAVGALAALIVWSAISVAWAPLVAPAIDSVERLLLYLAALLGAVALLRRERSARLVEPVLALGALVAIGYGISGRLLPDLIEQAEPIRAGGRLVQPITYWNAEGLLAAMGFVLCVRIAGDGSRPIPMRSAATASCALLGMGVYLSYSRGAIAAAAIGLLVLLAAAPTWPQSRATVTGLGSAAIASACAAALPGVASLEGGGAAQRRDGAIMLAVLVLVTLGAALVTARAGRAERRGAARLGTLRYARRLPAVAAAAAALCAAGLVIGGLDENADRPERAESGPARLASVDSARYEYWRVGLLAFGRDPLQGIGVGGFRVVWRMERSVDQSVIEVHSLVLEMATELGVPGLLLLGAFLGGIAEAARRALRRDAPSAAGPCAVCAVWLLHAAIDWDWQLPAVTLQAIVLAGTLIAMGERPTEQRGTSSRHVYHKVASWR